MRPGVAKNCVLHFHQSRRRICVREKPIYPRSMRISFRSANAMLIQRNSTHNQTRNGAESFSNLRDREIVRFLLYSRTFRQTTISQVINFRALARANRSRLRGIIEDNERQPLLRDRRWWIRFFERRYDECWNRFVQIVEHRGSIRAMRVKRQTCLECS